MRPRTSLIFITLTMACVLLFVADMLVGSASLAPADVWAGVVGNADVSTVMIVRHLRLIKAVVAILAGASLGISGLQMQTVFRNPLAGPYVLGITSGASLGVALLILAVPLFGFSLSGIGALGMAGAAWLGAALVLAVIASVSLRIRDIMVILILGMMFSSGVGAVVQILQYLSREDALKTFVVWTMGSLGDVTASQLAYFIPAVCVGVLLAIIAIKPLNLMLLGDEYALTTGLNLRRSRSVIFLSTTLLAGTVTAFCGPIGFIGMAVPHIARALVRTADNRILLPATALTGVAFMLVCDVVSKFFVLPVNSITALMGIPVVIWVVVSNRDLAS